VREKSIEYLVAAVAERNESESDAIVRTVKAVVRPAVAAVFAKSLRVSLFMIKPPCAGKYRANSRKS
jgi:hypothetical protein